MVEFVNQLSPSTYAIVFIAISFFFMFAGYLIASIWASYHIAKTVNKEIPKAKAGGKYIMPIAIVSLFVLPIVLDSLFLVDALKFIYYKLYMKDLQLHVNISNDFYTLSLFDCSLFYSKSDETK